MSKYLSKYLTEEDYNNNKDTHVKPHISYIVNPTKKMVYLQKTYIERYFTIEVFEDGTVGIDIPNSANSIKYRVNANKWVETSEAIQLSVSTNDKIQISCVCTKFENEIGESLFNISTPFKVYGNVMSLLFGDDFKGKTDLTGYSYAFCGLFRDYTTLTDASNLILPATTLADYCYYGMFSNCTSLTAAPVLPATTLADYCYCAMFQNCTSLTEAPALPATTLAEKCYNCMFSGTNVLPDCSNIDFSNEEVVTSCGLNGLFAGTKVTDADLERILPKNSEGKYCLPATTLASSCYWNMFYGCTSLVTAPELPATTLAEECYNCMFKGCTSLTVAPELPATTLAEECYNCMFYGCSSLTEAPELPATTLASYCYNWMFKGCTSLTVAPELPATTLTKYCYDGMFCGCSSLTHITMLATDISAKYCLIDWVNGIAPNGTFVKHPNMNSLSTGTSGIPSGWTVEDYVLQTNLITFYIGSTEYQAEEGMTWEQWINSEYNTDKLTTIKGDLKLVHYNMIPSTTGIRGDDIILNNTNYTFGMPVM